MHHTSNTCQMVDNLHRDLCAGAGPWRVDPEFLDESFTSTINFIVLVERVPELAVEEASFVSIAGSCGPPLREVEFLVSHGMDHVDTFGVCQHGKNGC